MATDANVTQVGVEEFASIIPPELRTTQAVVEEWSMVVTLVSVTALMTSQSAMSAVGERFFLGAAQMDGQSLMEGISVVTNPGIAEMDGQSEMLADGAAMAVGEARMDGLAQVEANSIDMTKGAAHMDGSGRLDGISVEGAGVAYMDGASSMAAVAPVIHKGNLLENLISGQATSVLMTYNPALSQGIVGGALMKPKMRYHLVSGGAINWSSTISFKMRFRMVIKDVTITMTPDLEPHTQFHYGLTAPLSVQSTMTPKWRAALALVQSLQLGQTTSDKFIWGRVLTEMLRVSAAPLDASTYYKIALAQQLKFDEIENFILSHPVALSQDINLSLSLIGKYGLKLLQKLAAAGTPSPALDYHLALTGRMKVADSLDNLVSEILAELFTVHPALDRQFIADSSLAQLLTIHPALNTKLVLKIVGNIQLSPEQLVSMVYRGDPLLDGVVITALYISPSGTTTTWVVNTRTNAVTEYGNYDFRSFASMGNRYIAAGPEGLYELDGDTDDGAAIISRMMGGYLQLNEKKMFGIKGAYVAIRGGGRFYLRLISGDGREYTYELRAQPNMMTTKVKVGKGIRTTYMAFELITEGQDFDLDSIEFIPMTSGRRV